MTLKIKKLKSATNLDKFVSGLEGCVKKSKRKPKEIKKIWKKK